ncbi:hypothetical protein [Planctomycetes bacterium K23_9]|uniref:hypothetical protein n=1 Tax=Stieleria marina TaxID=1930275 RepID=UPI0011A26ADE
MQVPRISGARLADELTRHGRCRSRKHAASRSQAIQWHHPSEHRKDGRCGRCERPYRHATITTEVETLPPADQACPNAITTAHQSTAATTAQSISSMIDRAPHDRANSAKNRQAITNDYVHAIRRITAVISEPGRLALHL